MYDPGGTNAAQLQKTHEIAVERLALIQAQRADLDIAITELKGQLVEIQGRIARFHAAAE